MAGVAQLVRASVCGIEGRGFESHRSPQWNSMGFFSKIKKIFSSSSEVKSVEKKGIEEKIVEQKSVEQKSVEQKSVEKTVAKKVATNVFVTPEMVDDLQRTLVQANFSFSLARDISDRLMKVSKKIRTAESAVELVRLSVRQCIEKYVRVRELPREKGGMTVIVLVGANGTGKTTLTPKLCKYYTNLGMKPLLAVGDTFRAAAQEQSQIWAQRAGVAVHHGAHKSDPASLAFEACERAKREGRDVVIVDTAGRLHTNEDLMYQLQKIVRVLGKFDKDFPHEVLLTLDSTTGAHLLSQVEGYKKFVDITGVILTKGDGYSTGGALMSLMYRDPVDILGVSYGEDIDSFGPFSLEKFLERVVQN